MKAKITIIHLGLSYERETFLLFKIKKYRYDCSSIDVDVLNQKFYLIQNLDISYLATKFKSTRVLILVFP